MLYNSMIFINVAWKIAEFSDQRGVLSVNPCVSCYLQCLAQTGTPDPQGIYFPRDLVA